MKRILFAKLALGWICLLSTQSALAQGLCKGSLGGNIFIKGDFGRGAVNVLDKDPGIAPGYRYSAFPPPNDGFYTVTNSTQNWGSFASSWVRTKDRSNDSDGYFMVVNASFQPGLFYQDTVTVCGNTTYQFSADIINLMLPNFPTPSIRPNLSFLVDGKEQYASGDVPQDGAWHAYGFSFTTPPNATQIVLSLRNNAPGGQGNDLGLDNIAFSPCGPRIGLPDNIVICNADFFTIAPKIAIDNVSALSFQWQKSEDQGLNWVSIPGANQATYQAALPREGQHFRLLAAASASQLNNASCNFFSEPIVLQQKKAPTHTNVFICPGGAITLGGKTFRQPGYYDVLVKTREGCDSIAKYQVLVEDLSGFRIKGDSIICPENISILEAGDFAQYRWSTGASSSSISIETPGVFSVSVTSIHGCPATHSLKVTARELLGDIFGRDPSCFGTKNGGIRFENVRGVNRPLSYTLDGKNFQANPLIEGLPAGKYEATAQVSPACKITRSITLSDPPGFQLEPLVGFSIKQLDSLLISPQANFPIRSIRWSPAEGLSCNACPKTIARPLRTAAYGVVAESEKGCIDSTHFIIFVEPRHNSYAPNVFSPNDDGQNEFFTLFCDKGVALIRRLSIFDRWGNEVFGVREAKPNAAESRWDGKSKGNPAPSGLYIWYADLEFVDGEKTRRQGEVQLLR
jgi:gliding motility-associated-like protein